MTTCQHKSVVWDQDEEKCRACGQSLTYPPRAPGLEDVKNRKRDVRIAAGESHRRYTRVEVEQDTQASTQLLACTCCKLTLPLSAFSINMKAVKRAQHSYQCRGCQAFRSRLARELDPATIRQKSRQRRARMVDEMTPEQREAAKLKRQESREATRAASARYYARHTKGRAVPRRRAGRPAILIKAVCRIKDNCPLASYCVNKTPSDQPQPLTRAGKGLA